MYDMSPLAVRSRLADQFVDNLRKLLEKRGWTQKELAEKSGRSENGISRIFSGTNQVRFDTLEAICEALDISASELFIDQ